MCMWQIIMNIPDPGSLCMLMGGWGPRHIWLRWEDRKTEWSNGSYPSTSYEEWPTQWNRGRGRRCSS